MKKIFTSSISWQNLHHFKKTFNISPADTQKGTSLVGEKI